MVSQSFTTHGESRKTAEYRCWANIRTRCYNPQFPQFKDYGGRGITVCDEWNNDYSTFLRDMGRKPHPSLTIERLDNNGNYEPDNCIWATRAQQNANKRRPNGLSV